MRRGLMAGGRLRHAGPARAARPAAPAAAARTVLLAACAGVAAGLTGMSALAAEPATGSAAEPRGEPLPDMAFIEYLGSWEEDDRDWIALAGTTDEDAEGRPSPPERAEDEERSSDEETG